MICTDHIILLHMPIYSTLMEYNTSFNTNKYVYNIKWHGLLELNLLTCNCTPPPPLYECTRVGWGILWFSRRYAAPSAVCRISKRWQRIANILCSISIYSQRVTMPPHFIRFTNINFTTPETYIGAPHGYLFISCAIEFYQSNFHNASAIFVRCTNITANNRRSGAWRFNDLLLGKSSGLYETLEIPGWLFRNWMWSPTILPKCEYFVCLLLSIQVNVISLVQKWTQ